MPTKVDASNSKVVFLFPQDQWSSGSELDGNPKSTSVFTTTPGASLTYSFKGDATSVFGDASADTVVTINVDGHISTTKVNPNNVPGIHPHQIFAVDSLNPKIQHTVQLTFDSNPALYVSQLLVSGKPVNIPKKEPENEVQPDDPDPAPETSAAISPAQVAPTPAASPAATTPLAITSDAPAALTTASPQSPPFVQTGVAPNASPTPDETVSIIVGTSVPAALSGPTTVFSDPAPTSLSGSTGAVTSTGMKSGVVAGAVVGSVMSFFLLVALFGWLFIRRRATKRRVYKRDPERNAGGSAGVRVSQTALVAAGEQMAQVDANYNDPAFRPGFPSYQGLWTPVDNGDRGFQSIARVQSLDSEIAAADAPPAPPQKSGFFSKLWNKSSTKAERHNSGSSQLSQTSLEQPPQPGQPFAGIPIHPDDLPRS